MPFPDPNWLKCFHNGRASLTFTIIEGYLLLMIFDGETEISLKKIIGKVKSVRLLRQPELLRKLRKKNLIPMKQSY